MYMRINTIENSAKYSEPMTLPVSMEDEQLFAKTSRLDLELSTKYSIEDELLDPVVTDEMLCKLSPLWWSRLLVATRGYVVNYFRDRNDDTVFLLDDAFINLHRCLVEGTASSARSLLVDLLQLVRVPHLDKIIMDLSSSKDGNHSLTSSDVFCRVFGCPTVQMLYMASKQLIAYAIFVHILVVLQKRWTSQQKTKKKSIRFEEDPEWQPDDRVVLFEQFFQGNRTWVLTDFDRHLLMFWRPTGVSVIFGDRYMQTKLDEGFKLCTYCGMLEQQRGQFQIGCHKCMLVVCSESCLRATNDEHERKCH